VCCLSASPLARTAAILGQFRQVADEIVCAVDPRVPQEELDELDGVVDVVRRWEIGPSTGAGVERQLPWLYSLCSGRWVLRIDNDEVPGAELLATLPELMRTGDVLQYGLPCRWIFPDSAHMIDERPWIDEWHMRLVRNEPFALRIPGTLHTAVNGVEPFRFVSLPFYHLSCVILRPAERQAKAATYEADTPGIESLPGWSVNNKYLPERFQQRPSVPVPRDDVVLIDEVLGAAPGRTGRRGSAARRRRSRAAETVPWHEVERTWPPRTVPPDAYRATWCSVPDFDELVAGEARRVYVEVRNDGSTMWPFGDQRPAIRLGYRWISSDRATVVADGIPTPFTADVAPGGTVLQPMMVYGPREPGPYVIRFSLVHEGVRWFGEGPTLAVTVRPA
jgi:hypothetical protein